MKSGAPACLRCGNTFEHGRGAPKFCPACRHQAHIDRASARQRRQRGLATDIGTELAMMEACADVVTPGETLREAHRRAPAQLLQAAGAALYTRWRRQAVGAGVDTAKQTFDTGRA